jgi:hypothetical protein
VKFWVIGFFNVAEWRDEKGEMKGKTGKARPDGQRAGVQQIVHA